MSRCTFAFCCSEVVYKFAGETKGDDISRTEKKKGNATELAKRKQNDISE